MERPQLQSILDEISRGFTRMNESAKTNSEKNSGIEVTALTNLNSDQRSAIISIANNLNSHYSNTADKMSKISMFAICLGGVNTLFAFALLALYLFR